MSIEPSRLLAVAALFACNLLLLAHEQSAEAQVYVGPNTQVRSLRFEGADSLPEKRLRSVMRTKHWGRGHRLRVAIGHLPFIDPPTRERFVPRVLQEDVVRLRREYAKAGFVGTTISYRVDQVVGREELLDIVMVVEEGKAQHIVDVRIRSSDVSAELPVPQDSRGSWRSVEVDALALRTQRLDSGLLQNQQVALQSWWRDHGYPAADVVTEVDRDSVRFEATVQFVIDTGRLSRFGEITIEGNQELSDRVARRQIGIDEGDRFSSSGVHEMPRDLQRLELVRSARPELQGAPANAAGDSIIPVHVRITEAKLHEISGDIGYVSDAGLSSDARWSHRNFTGGARVLTVSGLAQSGLLALVDKPDRRYLTGLSLQQPHAFHRRLTAIVNPYYEYRDDIGERSSEVGSHFTMVYQKDYGLNGSLDYRIATREIYEYRLGELISGDVDFLSFLSQSLLADQDAAGPARIKSSVFVLSGTWGSLDNFANPRRGFMFRPAFHVTAPNAWSSANYFKTEGSLYGFLPLTRRSVFSARVTAGRLFPFGRSIPSSAANSQEEFLRLREFAYVGGGTVDVRGWSQGQLGPKIPDLQYEAVGDSTRIVGADGYVPVGGLAKFSAAVELRMPFPPLGSHFGSFLFLDSGKVWTPDDRFAPGLDQYELESIYYGTGGGLEVYTPVGAIRVAVGYKLNPSFLDLVDANELTQAGLAGSSDQGIKQKNSRRFSFHISFGTSY